MKQIEITTKVNNTPEEIDKILSNQGFRIIRKSRIEDKYKTILYNELNKDNILEILSKCVLIRYLNVNNEQEFKKLTSSCHEVAGTIQFLILVIVESHLVFSVSLAGFFHDSNFSSVIKDFLQCQ